MHKNSRVAVVVVAAAIAIGAGLLAVSPMTARPPVEWTPEKVVETVTAGEETTIEVFFTPRRDLGVVEFRVVPELASLLTVSPTTFPGARAGETVQVLLTFTPSADSENGVTLNGVLQVRGQRGQTLARPLPVEVTVEWPTTSMGNVKVAFPPTWTAQEVPDDDEPIIGLSSPTGARVTILPNGGFAYGFDPEVDWTIRFTEISGHTAQVADFHSPSGLLLVRRLSFEPPLEQSSDFRIDFRPGTAPTSELSSLQEILDSLEVN